MTVYARPTNADASRPRVAILIRGLGLSQSATQTAIDTLPPEITLSFVPYPKDLQSWVNKARAAGHEVMLELPMEPYDYPDNDPGPSTLLTGLEPDENTKRLEWLLSRFTGYVGVTKVSAHGIRQGLRVRAGRRQNTKIRQDEECKC